MKRIILAILGAIGVAGLGYAQAPMPSYHSDVNRPLTAAITSNLSTVPTVPAAAYTQSWAMQTSQPVQGVVSPAGCSSCSQSSPMPIPERRCESQSCHRSAFDRIRGWFGHKPCETCISPSNCVQFSQPSYVQIPLPTRSCGVMGQSTCGWLSGPCASRGYMANGAGLFGRLGSIFSCGSACRGCGGWGGCIRCKHTPGSMPDGNPYLGSFKVTQSVADVCLDSTNTAYLRELLFDKTNTRLLS